MILAMATLTWWFMWTLSGGASTLMPTTFFATKLECETARKDLMAALTRVGVESAEALKCEQRAP